MALRACGYKIECTLWNNAFISNINYSGSDNNPNTRGENMWNWWKIWSNKLQVLQIEIIYWKLLKLHNTWLQDNMILIWCIHQSSVEIISIQRYDAWWHIVTEVRKRSAWLPRRYRRVVQPSLTCVHNLKHQRGSRHGCAQRKASMEDWNLQLPTDEKTISLIYEYLMVSRFWSRGIVSYAMSNEDLTVTERYVLPIKSRLDDIPLQSGLKHFDEAKIC